MTQNREYYKKIDECFSELRQKGAKSLAKDDVIGYYEKRTQEMQKFIQSKKSTSVSKTPILTRELPTPIQSA